jgi:prophage tail gpP-like protein
MKTYMVIKGDTFESIARKIYGVESESILIISANPEVNEPLQPGIILITPEKNIGKGVSLGLASNTVKLFIDANEWQYWTECEYQKSIDSFSSVTFSSPFNPKDKVFRDAFRPFSFRDVFFAIDDKILMSGTMLTPKPSLDADKQIVNVVAYSRCSVMNDCMTSTKLFPLEFNNSKIDYVAKVLSNSFGLTADFRAASGSRFERVAVAPDKQVVPFLIDLCQQRNIVISDNEYGNPVFWQSLKDGEIIANFNEGDPAVISVEPFFSEQDYYSHISSVSNADIGDSGSIYTVKNPFLLDAFRPFVFVPKDANKANNVDVARAKMGRMFANAVSYTITVPTWRDPSGALWDVNKFVNLYAPGAMVYNKTKMLIRQIKLTRVEDSETAQLNLILPGGFSGEFPGVLPWAE